MHIVKEQQSYRQSPNIPLIQGLEHLLLYKVSITKACNKQQYGQLI